MTSLALIQGSQEWHQARLGRVTASRMADVTARTKTGWGAARGRYMTDLVGERLTGLPTPSYPTAAMRWGTEQEPFARAAYEFLTDATIELVGFVDHPTIAGSGASPDGLIGADGLVEIKCPGTSTHINTLLSREVPEEHLPQIMWQLACTGRKWCDFVSFDPRFPENMCIVVARVMRDDAYILRLEEAVRQFLGEVDATINMLSNLAENREFEIA
jgi:putative phage-type endonuclease